MLLCIKKEKYEKFTQKICFSNEFVLENALIFCTIFALIIISDCVYRVEFENYNDMCFCSGGYFSICTRDSAR